MLRAMAPKLARGARFVRVMGSAACAFCAAGLRVGMTPGEGLRALLTGDSLRSLLPRNCLRCLVASGPARARATMCRCLLLARKCLRDLRVFCALRRLRLTRGVRICVCGRAYLNALKIRALRVFAASAIVDMSVIVHPTYYRDVARRPPHLCIDIHTIGTAPSRTRHAATP